MYINGIEYMIERGWCEPGRAYATRKERLLEQIDAAKRSQVIRFDTEQVKVFWDLIKNKRFLPSVDYRLPFEHTWIQFTRNIVLEDYGTPIFPDQGHSALLLTQYNTGFNRLVVVHEENDEEVYTWEAHAPMCMGIDNPPTDPSVTECYRLLAAACIQYINCENIYLEKQGEVPEAVNRKREAKGKSRLEPYYVCRIRGVQYDSQGTGEGSKHGIRYDVRGHFRRLETGKTIWVRPHQRGLTNELYVPKVYKVSKGAKPAGELGRTGTKV